MKNKRELVERYTEQKRTLCARWCERPGPDCHVV